MLDPLIKVRMGSENAAEDFKMILTSLTRWRSPGRHHLIHTTKKGVSETVKLSTAEQDLAYWLAISIPASFDATAANDVTVLRDCPNNPPQIVLDRLVLRGRGSGSTAETWHRLKKRQTESQTPFETISQSQSQPGRKNTRSHWFKQSLKSDRKGGNWVDKFTNWATEGENPPLYVGGTEHRDQQKKQWVLCRSCTEPNP